MAVGGPLRHLAAGLRGPAGSRHRAHGYPRRPVRGDLARGPRRRALGNRHRAPGSWVGNKTPGLIGDFPGAGGQHAAVGGLGAAQRGEGDERARTTRVGAASRELVNSTALAVPQVPVAGDQDEARDAQQEHSCAHTKFHPVGRDSRFRSMWPRGASGGPCARRSGSAAAARASLIVGVPIPHHRGERVSLPLLVLAGSAYGWSGRGILDQAPAGGRRGRASRRRLRSSACSLLDAVGGSAEVDRVQIVLKERKYAPSMRRAIAASRSFAQGLWSLPPR